MDNKLDRYRFPKTLSEQSRFFGMPIDEAIPVLLLVGWGLMSQKNLFGIISAAFVWFVIRSAKRGKGSMWLYNLMYWYLPWLNSNTVFKILPDSSFRQWIK